MQAALKLIQQRFAALRSQDFASLYASYHSQAPFIEQFPREQDYLAFAAASLARMQVLQAHIGDLRETGEGVEVVCGLHFELDGLKQVIFELALLIREDGRWRYHSAQKLTAEDYQGDFAGLDFAHFDAQTTKIRF